MREKIDIDTNIYAVKSFLINFFVPLICLGISIVLGILVIYPSIISLPKLKTDLSKNIELENQLATKVIKLNKLVDFKKVVDEDSAIVSKILVSESMVPQLLTQIDQIATESGLEANKLSYSFNETSTPGSPSGGGTTFVSIALGASGSYSQIQAFLSTLENAARIINVSNFRYTLSESPEKTFLGANFSLNSPYLYVQSNATTDDAINMDITDKKFIDFINKIKLFKYYDITINSEVVNKASQESSSSAKPAATP